MIYFASISILLFIILGLFQYLNTVQCIDVEGFLSQLSSTLPKLTPLLNSPELTSTIIENQKNDNNILLPWTIDSNSPKPILILNAMDKDGLQGALWFAQSIRIYSSDCLGKIYIFVREKDIKDYLKSNEVLEKLKPYEIVYYKDREPLEDKTIGKMKIFKEHVTDILESWEYITTTKDTNSVVISLSFMETTIPVATPYFLNILDKFYRKNVELMLLSKTKKMTSSSDWHDLSLAIFNIQSTSFQQWLRIFHEVYYHHGANGRAAFTLLDPRPAILEASAQLNGKMNIEHFDTSMACSTTTPFQSVYNQDARGIIVQHMRPSISKNDSGVCTSTIGTGLSKDHQGKANLIATKLGLHHNGKIHLHSDNPHEESKCLELSVYSNDVKFSSIEFYCGNTYLSPNHQASMENINNCLLLSLPTRWYRTIHRNVASELDHVAGRSLPDIFSNPMHLMWKGGVLRFRNTTEPDKPLDYCWNTGSYDEEEVADAKIEYDLIRYDKFNHTLYDKYTTNPSNITAVIMVGIPGSADKINERLYLSLSKLYYTKRHGYKFEYVMSNEFTNYFANDLFQKVPYENMLYFRGIMTKPIMILDVMLSNLDKEWIVWTDDDVYPNAGWTYMPLDAYLSDVPKHKVMVLANYRSTFTNLLAIRNTPQGRRLMYDWLAIAMSGYVQCHGFDQAALGVLIINRMSNDTTFSTPRPLGFQCIHNDADGKVGCNNKGDWSCDFKFEQALHKVGFRTNFAIFHEGKISSYSKGCANDFVKDFHIVTETKERPRLQCAHCTRASEIESADHWDGPLGGGNDLLRAGAINGWMFNHKGEFLMYETYINPKACKRIDNIMENCDAHGQNQLSHEEHQKIHKHILPIADGIAYDIHKRTFCKITNPHTLKHQRETTYMKSYPMLIDAISKIPEDQWQAMYRDYEGGEGRSRCREKPECYRTNKDGQKYRRPYPPNNMIFGRYFEHENYCEADCRVVPAEGLNKGNLEYALDCTK